MLWFGPQACPDSSPKVSNHGRKTMHHPRKKEFTAAKESACLVPSNLSKLFFRLTAVVRDRNPRSKRRPATDRLSTNARGLQITDNLRESSECQLSSIIKCEKKEKQHSCQMSRVQALNRYPDVFSSGLPKPRHWLRLSSSVWNLFMLLTVSLGNWVAAVLFSVSVTNSACSFCLISWLP